MRRKGFRSEFERSFAHWLIKNDVKYEDTDDREDLSGIDIPQAVEEFVNLLEIKNKKEIIDYTLGLYEKSKL